MPGHDLIVVGASAGGVEVLVKLVGQLPVRLPASLFLVLHIPPDSPSLLPGILSRSGPLAASHQKGKIYVVPANRQVSIREAHFIFLCRLNKTRASKIRGRPHME